FYGFLTFGVVSVIGSLLIAKPGSYWARHFYDDAKRARAWRRATVGRRSAGTTDGGSQQRASSTGRKPPKETQIPPDSPLARLTRAEMESVLGAESLYETLRVSPSASPNELRIAYHERCKALHPDLHDGDGARGAELAAVNDAWAILRAEHLRAAYDW